MRGGGSDMQTFTCFGDRETDENSKPLWEIYPSPVPLQHR